MIRRSNTAILILTCNDFEALDITLNQVVKTTPDDVKIYLLSNCWGKPGADVCEKICMLASRAQFGRIHWINPKKSQPAYFGIRSAIEEHIDADFIVKLDDDVFPITDTWLDELIDCYNRHQDEEPCYVTGLVNNNPWGFGQLARLEPLRARYSEMMPFPHLAGEFIPGYQDFRTVAPGEIDTGGWGTVWQFPQLARWIHEETTLQPERFIEMVRALEDVEVDNSQRYSINVMLFKRTLWEEMKNDGHDDEEMAHRFSRDNNRKIISSRKTPFVHLYFGPQKQFLLDIVDKARQVYRPMDAIAGHEMVADWIAFKQSRLVGDLKKKLSYPDARAS